VEIPPINQQVAFAAKASREGDWPAEFIEAYNAAWATIDEVNNVIGRLNKPVFDLDKEDAEIVFLMFFNSLSDVIGAVYTLTSGWIRPSVMTLRGALETMATAIVLHHKPDMMMQFKSGNLKIPGPVLAMSKKFFPSLPRLYSALTEQFTHETFDTTARSINEPLGQLMLIPKIDLEHLPVYLNVFVECICLTQMLGMAAETCFPELAGSDTYYTLEPNNARRRRQALSDEALQRAVAARESARKAYFDRNQKAAPTN
jgi:hypothetical protein